MAQGRHCTTEFRCPLLGVKRTLIGRAPMSAFDPKADIPTLNYSTLTRIRPFKCDNLRLTAGREGGHETMDIHKRVPNGGWRPRGLDRV